MISTLTLYRAKIDFFTPERATTTKVCEECGDEFEVVKNLAWRARYCPNCRDGAAKERSKASYESTNISDTGDPATNLALAVIQDAIKCARRGDRDAFQWPASPSGAELLLRACGVAVRPSYRQELLKKVMQ